MKQDGRRQTTDGRVVRFALVSAALVLACGGGGATGDGRVVQAAAALPARFGVGRAATPEEVAAWNLDVNAKGEGLPAGSGTATAGAAVYAAKCAVCHGVKGEGGTPPNAKLVGRDFRDFSFADSARATKTIGNYWPYATTLYDYIRRAMPQNAPGTLTADETYGVIAWLLAENEVITRDQVMDAKSLPAVVMPSRDRFVRDDRTGGPGFK
jgi:S-disulfanyl-L-cysteine oxidoreductase SoxD